jgi:hypothetical protein
MENFIKDIDVLTQRLTSDMSEEQVKEVQRLRDRLIELRRQRVVNTAHSIMELIVAKYLITRGYRTEVEYTIDSISCDVYGEKGLGNTAVEIETGYVPPYHALDPHRYLRARIASKIARYSGYSSKFVIGIPQHYRMPIEEVFLLPPRQRRRADLMRIKKLCDLYYSNPPVSLSEIKNARLHSIYILDVDNTTLVEVDPETYYEMYIESMKF